MSGFSSIWKRLNTYGAPYPEVMTYADLPPASAHTGEIYVVKTSTGIPLLTRKDKGFYRSNGSTWEYLSDIYSYFDSATFRVYDTTDNSKNLELDISTVSTNTTRTLSVPNKSGTIATINDETFTGKTGVNELQFDTTPSLTTQTPGKVRWDDTNATLAVELTNPGGGNDVTLQVGQESHIYAKNTSGGSILNGEVVLISGASGNRIVVGKAKADTLTNGKAVAVATADVADNGFGYFTTFGNVGNINTNSFNEGDQLYLSSSTAGAFTATAPTGTNVVTEIGVVTNKSTNQGSIHVRIATPETAVMHSLAQATTVTDQQIALKIPELVWAANAILRK